jgi:MFS family permease
MRGVLRLIRTRRDFRLVVGASLISQAGDWILMVGLMYRVYAATGSTAASALLMLTYSVPQVVLGSLAGVFVDRWDRKRTMVAANLMLAGGLLPLLWIHGRTHIWMVFPVLFFESIVQQFFSPAEQALFPSLVADEELVAANALNGQNQNAARLIGSALGGVIGASGGIPAVTLADLASFLVAAGMVGAIAARARSVTTAAADSLRGRLTALRTQWVEGMRIAAREEILIALAIFIGITSIGEGDISTLFAPFVRHILHGGNAAFGLIAAVQAIGGIVGGVVAAVVGPRLSAVRLFVWSAVAFGVLDLGITLYPLAYVAIWPAVIGMILVGVPAALMMAGMMTLYQRHAADAYRGRLWGAFMAVSGLGTIFGTTAAGLLAQSLGVIPVLAYQGLGYLGAGFYVMHRLRLHPASLPDLAAAEEDA